MKRHVLRQALEELGLSTEDLTRIIQRLAGVAGSNLQSLQNLLVAAGSRILEKVEEAERLLRELKKALG